MKQLFKKEETEKNRKSPNQNGIPKHKGKNGDRETKKKKKVKNGSTKFSLIDNHTKYK